MKILCMTCLKRYVEDIRSSNGSTICSICAALAAKAGKNEVVAHNPENPYDRDDYGFSGVHVPRTAIIQQQKVDTELDDFRKRWLPARYSLGLYQAPAAARKKKPQKAKFSYVDDELGWPA